MPTVTEQQKHVHQVAETIALAVVVPGLVAIAASPRVPTPMRVFSGLTAAGTLIVDGWLLVQWAKE